MSRSEDARVGKRHGHLADDFIYLYGISKNHRTELCHKIDEMFKEGETFHGLIYMAVRGYLPSDQKTLELKAYLESHQTRSPPKPLRERKV